MSITVSCYGGKAGWYFKKKFPHIAAFAYIKTNFWLRRRNSIKYINWFMNQKHIPKPLFISIETINRCNSDCSFCPANRNNDKRPFAQMSDEMFYKIIEDLKIWGYKGIISLYVNNEPFLDKRIIHFHQYVKSQLPDCRIKLFTNGVLLSREKFLEIIPYVDYVVINNYSDSMAMHENIREIYNYVKRNPSQFQHKDIKINIRYIRDVLTNRAGEAPNKKATMKIINEPCLFPYTDMTIFSNGNVGICCNDATEKTCLGNVMKSSLKSIWEDFNGNEPSYRLIRKLISNGRAGYNFCKHCDTLDTGLRVKTSKSTTKKNAKK